MKKIFLTSALALAAISASAYSFEPGSKKDNLQDLLPINTDFSNPGTQSLYTADLLTPFWKVGPDGTITAAEIKSLSLEVLFSENYYGSMDCGTTDFTVYLQNTSATEFEKTSDEKNYKWMKFDTTCVGQGTLNADDIFEALMYGEPLTVTVTFDTPFKYTGESILVTWINSTEDTTSNSINEDSLWGFSPSNKVNSLFTGNFEDIKFEDSYAEGVAPYTSKCLPSITFEYETYEITSGPEIVYGEPADFEVGNFDDPEIKGQNSGDFMPFDGVYAHSGTQALYTNVELNGLNKITDGEVTKAEVQDITFLVSAADDMWFLYDENFETTVYVQNSEATKFEEDSTGKIKWFEYSDEYKGTVTVVFSENEEWESFTYGEGGLYPVTIHLDKPILYEGESLLFTFVTEADCGDVNWVNGTAALLTSGIQGANKSSDKETFDQMYANGLGYPQNTWSYVPVLKLHYVPVTEKGGTKVTPVTFENVKVSLVESDTTVGQTQKANAIAINFELNDPSNCGEYEIKVGTTSVGTINSTEGTITYVGLPAGDTLTLNVVPAGEGTIGVTYEIAKSDLDALFPAPVMEVEKTAFADFSYSLTELPESVKTQGAAQFFFSNYEDAPVSQFNWLDLMNPGDKNVSLLRSGSGAVADLITDYVADYKDVQRNNGRIAFGKTEAVTANIDSKTAAVTSFGNGYLYISLAVDYPLYYSAVPTLAEGKQGDLENGNELKVQTIQRKYDNGQSYGSNQLRAEFKEFTNPGEIEVLHPETLVWKWNESNKTITIAGPKGSSLHYRQIETVAPAALEDEDGFIKHENELPYLVLSAEPYTGTTLHVQARTESGDVHSELYLDVDDEVVTGIRDIETEGNSQAEYYNLQGIRVNGDLAPGIYIRRQGNKSAKVIVK